MSQKFTNTEFINAVKNAHNLTSVCTNLNLTTGSANYRTIRTKIEELNLDVTHFRNFIPTSKCKKINYENVLSQNAPIKNFKNLKKYIIKNKLLQYKCLECNLLPIWNNKKLVLQLDHIDGNKSNNLLTNLRFLCPNCHTQTETFCTRNKKHILNNKCLHCETLINKYSYVCKEHTTTAMTIPKPRPTKIIWPEPDILKKLVFEKSTTQLAKDLGVSDKAIEKHCKKFNIPKPTRGYWAKLYATK